VQLEERIGVTVAAVAGIANKLNSVCGLVANSVNTAGAPMNSLINGSGNNSQADH